MNLSSSEHDLLLLAELADRQLVSRATLTFNGRPFLRHFAIR